MPRFSEETIREIRMRVDIVALISEYVSLRKSGKNYVGLCPFHQDRSPSFTVDPEKGLFYCFGCGAGGNVFSFLMKKDGLSFPEAVRVLARRAGIEISEEQEPARYEALERALQFAQERFREMIYSRSGSAALKYLTSRGLDRETIDKFGLGYAPNDWDFISRLAKRNGFTEDVLKNAGLAIPRESGGVYDRFRNRVTFPIWDASGRLIGFAGRTIANEEPKYLNSPDTPIFHKGKELYALNLAKQGIRRSGKIIVMEGYMDVISAFQHGIDYAVAGMGTALTPAQARAMLLLSQDVILCYDQDEAGRRATRRSIEVFREAGGRTRVISFSGAKDPDELLRSQSKEKLLEAISRALPDVEFLYNEVRGAFGRLDIDSKLKIRETVVSVLALISDEFELRAYIDEIGREMDVPGQILLKDVAEARNSRQQTKYKKSENNNTTSYDGRRVAQGSSQVSVARKKAEEGIIRCLVENPELLSWANDHIGVNELLDPYCHLAFSLMRERPSGWFEDEHLSSWLAELCAKFGPVEEPEKVLKDCVRKLKEFRLRELRDQIAHLQRSGDEAKVIEILTEYQKLLKEVKSTGDNLEAPSPDGFPGREVD